MSAADNQALKEGFEQQCRLFFPDDTKMSELICFVAHETMTVLKMFDHGQLFEAVDVYVVLSSVPDLETIKKHLLIATINDDHTPVLVFHNNFVKETFCHEDGTPVGFVEEYPEEEEEDPELLALQDKILSGPLQARHPMVPLAKLCVDSSLFNMYNMSAKEANKTDHPITVTYDANDSSTWAPCMMVAFVTLCNDTNAENIYTEQDEDGRLYIRMRPDVKYPELFDCAVDLYNRGGIVCAIFPALIGDEDGKICMADFENYIKDCHKDKAATLRRCIHVYLQTTSGGSARKSPRRVRVRRLDGSEQYSGFPSSRVLRANLQSVANVPTSQ